MCPPLSAPSGARRYGKTRVLLSGSPCLLSRSARPLRRPKFLDIKRRVHEGVSAAHPPFELSPFDDRFSRAALRIALRQIKTSGAPEPSIDASPVEHHILPHHRMRRVWCITANSAANVALGSWSCKNPWREVQIQRLWRTHLRLDYAAS
jgi:hypothetical protein